MCLLRRILAVVLVLGATSCGTKGPDASIQSIPFNFKSSFVSHQENLGSEVVPESFFAGRLERFFSSEGYFVPLYFKEDVSESVFAILDKVEHPLLFSGDEERRSALSTELAETHFITSGLKKLVLLDSFQNVVETLKLAQFEYLQSNSGSSYKASYKADKGYNGYHVVSLEALAKNGLRKSPSFETDPEGITQAFSKNNLKPDHTHFHGTASHGKHQFLVASFINYKRRSNAVYLFKDGLPVDSIVKAYCLFDFKPLPLGTDEKGFYTAHGGIPETDAVWDQLFEINWKKGKLIMHERNRFHN